MTLGFRCQTGRNHLKHSGGSYFRVSLALTVKVYNFYYKKIDFNVFSTDFLQFSLGIRREKAFF